MPWTDDVFNGTTAATLESSDDAVMESYGILLWFITGDDMVHAGKSV